MFSGLALISIYHYYYVIRYIGDGTDVFVTTAFKWIGFRDNEMDVYLLLMPVIASLPFSTSYNSDKSDDFKPFISKRISLFPYSVTKYIVTFLRRNSLYVSIHLIVIILHFNHSKRSTCLRYWHNKRQWDVRKLILRFSLTLLYISALIFYLQV